MALLNIGRINYINTLPLFTPFLMGYLPLNGRIIPGTPAELNKQLLNDELDIATISSIAFLQNQNKYEFLPNLGIAARERVMSVSLYIKDGLPITAAKYIGLTEESASAVQLVKILYSRYWNACPEYTVMNGMSQLREFDAFLLIGDKALLQPSFKGYRTVDLAASWHQATGLGLPFGVFAVRKAVLEQKRAEVLTCSEAFQNALKWSFQHLDIVIELAMQKCPLPRNTIEEYFRTLRFELHPPEIEGLKQFALDAEIAYLQ